MQFRLLVEREDPVRGDVVLNATGDAINALVGGLEFDVEDEQAANEFLLERQLARGAFESAEGGAHRARALSVRLASELTELLRPPAGTCARSWTTGRPWTDGSTMPVSTPRPDRHRAPVAGQGP